MTWLLRTAKEFTRQSSDQSTDQLTTLCKNLLGGGRDNSLGNISKKTHASYRRSSSSPHTFNAQQGRNSSNCNQKPPTRENLWAEESEEMEYLGQSFSEASELAELLQAGDMPSVSRTLDTLVKVISANNNGYSGAGTKNNTSTSRSSGLGKGNISTHESSRGGRGSSNITEARSSSRDTTKTCFSNQILYPRCLDYFGGSGHHERQKSSREDGGRASLHTNHNSTSTFRADGGRSSLQHHKFDRSSGGWCSAEVKNIYGGI